MKLITFIKFVVPFATVLAAAGCEKGPKSGSPGAAAKPAPADKSDEAVTPPGAAGAAAPAAAVPGKAYGNALTLTERTSIDTLLADPKAYSGKVVQVEGLITDVCAKRGCWFAMAGEGPGNKLRFKVQDGEMVFPMEAKGQYAVAEGTVSVTELTLEESKEHAVYLAKEAGKELDPATITEPTTVVQIDGTAAVVRDTK